MLNNLVKTKGVRSFEKSGDYGELRSGSQLGATLPARGHSAMSGNLLNHDEGVGGRVPLASSGSTSGMSLNTLHCSGQTHTQQRHLSSPKGETLG